MTKEERKEYADEFKLRVLSDYYSSGKSKNFIATKWGVTAQSLRNWQKVWPIDSKELSLPAEIIRTYRMGSKDRGKTDDQILQERIADLERSLQLERMRCRALEKVIEIAELEEGISILKKGGVRQ